MATDDAGHIFVQTGILGESVVAKTDPSGITTLLHTGLVEEQSGLAVRSRSAPTPEPLRLAADRAGGVIAASNTRIVLIKAGPATIAGRRMGGSARKQGGSGDGGPAQGATFRKIKALATDGKGNLFIADEVPRSDKSFRIRYINRSPERVVFNKAAPDEVVIDPGEIETIADDLGTLNAKPPKSTEAKVEQLRGETVRLAASGNRLYIGTAAAAGRPPVKISVLNASEDVFVAHGVVVKPWAIEQIAAYGGRSLSRERTAGRGSPSSLGGIDADDKGQLFIAEERNHRILRLDRSGRISVFTGKKAGRSFQRGFNGNDRPATGAALNRPYDVKVGRAGLVFVSDSMNGQVRYIDEAGIIHAAPGNGQGISWICGAPGARRIEAFGQRLLVKPAKVAVAGASRAYFVDSELEVARKWAPGVVDPVRLSKYVCRGAGCDKRSQGAPDVKGVKDVAVAPRRGIYFLKHAAPPGTGQILFYNLQKRTLKIHGVHVEPGSLAVVAGGGTKPVTGGERAKSVRLQSEGSLAVDNEGNLFVADLYGGRVHRVDKRGVLETLVQHDVSSPTHCCRQPGGVAIASTGGVYISDRYGSRIWFLNVRRSPVILHGHVLAPGELIAVAGSGRQGFGGDGGPALNASLQAPEGVAVDRRGNLYIADPNEHVVRVVNAAGVIRTFAGTGTAGFNGDGLKGPATALNFPTDVAVSGCKDVFVADSGNRRLRRFPLDRIC